MAELLVLTDTHPDEKKASHFGESLRQHPALNIDSVIANIEARKQGKRFVDINLMAAYPGDLRSAIYEERRAAEILQMIEEKDPCYYGVIDLHNVRENPTNDTTAVINEKQGVTPRVLGMLARLGIKNLMISEGVGVIDYHPNAFAIEMATNFDTDQLRSELDILANGESEPGDITQFAWFKYIDSLHLTQLDPRQIPEEEYSKLEAFQPVNSPALTRIIGQRACLMGWSRTPNKQGYWGELVTPTGLPDTRSWPKDTI